MLIPRDRSVLNICCHWSLLKTSQQVRAYAKDARDLVKAKRLAIRAACQVSHSLLLLMINLNYFSEDPNTISAKTLLYACWRADHQPYLNIHVSSHIFTIPFLFFWFITLDNESDWSIQNPSCRRVARCWTVRKRAEDWRTRIR